MKQLNFLIITLILSFSLNAQWSQLSDPLISTVEYDGIVYTGQAVIIATQGGVYRSVNDGVTWELSVNGFAPYDISAYQISYIPSRNEVWVRGDRGIFKSTNHAETWTQVPVTGVPEGSMINGLARVNNRLVLICNTWDNFLNTNFADLYYSDDGVNWTKGATLGSVDNKWWDMQRTDNNSFILLVQEDYSGGENNNSIWITEDATDIEKLPNTGLAENVKIRSRLLTVDPQGKALLLCDENNSKVMSYDFTANIWIDRTNELNDPEVEMFQLFNLQTLGEHTFASGMWVTDFLAQQLELRLYYSSDTAKTWTKVPVTGLDMPMFSNSFVKTTAGRLVTEYFNSGIVYSDNNGQAWAESESVPAGEFHSLVSLSNGKLFTITENPMTGLLLSADNGNNWLEVSTDLPEFMGLSFINQLVADGNTLYGFVQESPFDESQKLYKSTNEGVNWTRIDNIPGETEEIYYLGKHGTSLIFMFRYKDSGDNDITLIRRTPDAGATWVDMTSGIYSAEGLNRFAGIQSNGALLILFGRDGMSQTQVYISFNNGTSYQKITGNLYNNPYEVLIGNMWDWRKPENAIGAFSEDGLSFYLAVYDWSGAQPWGVKFLKLNNTFNGWDPVNDDKILIPPHLKYHALFEKDAVWYFFFPMGVGVSADTFQTRFLLWNNEGYRTGLEHNSVIVNDYGVFTGTRGTGIWRAPITLPEFTTLTEYEVTDTSAMSGATITSTGGLPFLSRGLCWSTSSGPTIDNNVRYAKPPLWTSYTDTLKILSPSTTYYARAFIKTPKGLVYGNQISFVTDQATNIILEEERSVRIYPNPANGVFFIESAKSGNVTIVNLTGRVVYENQIREGTTTIDIERQPPGIYLVKLEGHDGEVKVTRLIKR